MPKTVLKRLLEQFVPTHYDLQFDLDHEQLTFRGQQTIVGNLPHRSNRLMLHSKELQIRSLRLGAQELRWTLDSEADELCVQLPEPMTGELQLSIEYSGAIGEQMHGIYVCNFEVDGVKKRIVATQFESHHAREAFPCVDEPAGKATFDVGVRVSSDILVVLGNMPTRSEETSGGHTLTVFETTPRMSPYLLAFVAGELHNVEGQAKDGVMVRSWAHIGIETAQLQFSLDHAIRSIEFFNDYYGTDYPLAKCDHVALPDFEFGAMENWGLITYRESILLCDPDNRSHAQERDCAMVVSHELSHQWFGNLVTMDWWDDLWLNESFARIMEYICLNRLYPDWSMWDAFIAEEVIYSVKRDVLPGVQQVGVPVKHPDEIHSLFDPAIVYAKGSRLLNMLRGFIGDKAFQKGLQGYFEQHAYQNTTREDLWAAMEKVSAVAISDLMTPWLTQPNLPLLQVEHNEQHYTISQCVFCIDDTAQPERMWPVPLFAQPEIDTRLLSTKEHAFSAPELVRFNSGALAHVIVYYEAEDDRSQLCTQLTTRQMPASDRVNYLNDLVLLARGGILSIVDVVRATLACQEEDREAVWHSMAYTLSAARVIAEGYEMAEDRLKQACWQLANSTIDRLGWQKQDETAINDNQVRMVALGVASHSDHPDYIKAIRPLYDQYCEKWEDCDSDLRPLVMTAAIEYEFEGGLENLLSIIADPEVLPDLEVDAASALTSVRKEYEIVRLIGLLTDKDMVRQQDLGRWFGGLLSNKYAREKTWQWMVDEWAWIEENFAETASYDQFPRIGGAVFKTAQELDTYKAFFEPKLDEVSLKRTIGIGIGEIEARIAWRDRDQQKLHDWLSKQT